MDDLGGTPEDGSLLTSAKQGNDEPKAIPATLQVVLSNLDKPMGKIL